MNKSLSPAQVDTCLYVLYQGLIQIRSAGFAGDVERATAIADALHNLPDLIRIGDDHGWTIARFRELFLVDLIRSYPELKRLDEALRLVE